jgi:hypothetical protein
MIFGAVLGFATSAVAQLLHGVSIEQWLRLAPAAQEIYVAGMLDAMGGLNIKGAVYAHYDLKRSAKCIRKNSINAQQLAQGMANYAKLNPAKFSTGIPGLPAPFLQGGMISYFEFVCPDLFNEAADKRADADAELFSQFYNEHPTFMRED